MAGQRRTSSIDVDTASFEADIRRQFAALALTCEQDLVRVGLDVQNRARSLCPVDTGRLRSSIQMVKGKDRDGVYVEIGTNVEYAVFVEFGTSRAHAQPFLRPALAEAAAHFTQRFGTH